MITSAEGKRWQFNAGDAWVIPAGFSGTWETVEPARKRYAVFEAAKPCLRAGSPFLLPVHPDGDADRPGPRRPDQFVEQAVAELVVVSSAFSQPRSKYSSSKAFSTHSVAHQAPALL